MFVKRSLAVVALALGFATAPAGAQQVTWNVGFVNASLVGGPGFACEFDLDGVPTWSLSVGAFGAWAPMGVIDARPYSFYGGRHTLSALYDWPDRVKESYEDNNTYGEQYVWGPRTMPMEGLFFRLPPPDRMGGWAYNSDAVRYYDCDGWRTPKFTPSGGDGYWGGVVTLPGGDVDLRLHELASGSKTGFDANYGISGWGPGQTDFAIVNLNKTTPRAFDVGVLGTAGLPSMYYGEVVRSRYLATYPNGTYGPFTFDHNTLMRLHEVYLLAGTYVVHLTSDAGKIDWGASVYGPSSATYVKSDAIGAAWISPGGIDESFSFTAPSVGYYCVAVWRVDATGSNDGTYRLQFRSGTVDAPGVRTPAATRLAPPSPNPSGGSTQVGFTVAREQSVTLAVYDVRGARVRTLAMGHREAGEYHLAWDGRDDAGRATAPGLYLVRLDSGSLSSVRKLVRLR